MFMREKVLPAHAAPVNGKSAADKAVNRALRSIDGSVIETKNRAFALLSV